jgi:hypothetical protein
MSFPIRSIDDKKRNNKSDYQVDALPSLFLFQSHGMV